ncbi:phage late control D family protein [Chromobacterium vaccinii]|uniref:phage late control D family protein n=1 Tax=Chromobacterium vaccinii TaxID=1108595 RepID=UPI003C716FC7
MEAISNRTGPKRPVFFIQYEGANITADISRDFIRLVYCDKRSGEADELEITLENSHGRWSGSWYPEKGDRIVASIGYDGEAMLPCGSFEVDECELSGAPDEITIKALAAGITRAVRTRQTRAYNGQTLASIAGTVAQRNGLTLAGAPDPIPLSRITQNQETDLGFLRRVAERYGHMVAVRGDALYVAPHAAVEDRDAVLMIAQRGDLKSYRARDKTNATYKSVTVAFLDPKTGKLVEHTEHAKVAKRKRGDKVIEEKADTLKLNERAENKQQAVALAKAALRDKNLRAVEGEFELVGDPRLLAGNTLNLACLGTLDGDYLLSESRHTVSRSDGWSVSVTGQRLRTAAESKEAASRRRTTKKGTS